jgi:hypothetical protein
MLFGMLRRAFATFMYTHEPQITKSRPIQKKLRLKITRSNPKTKLANEIYKDSRNNIHFQTL